MQNNIKRHEHEKLEADLKLLNLRLATAEAEYEKIQQELLAIEASQTKVTSNKPGRGITVATASVLAVITLSFTFVYHDALSNVKENSQYDASVMRELVNGPIVRSEVQSKNRKLSSSWSARAKKATQQQWGPSLLLPDAADKKQHGVFCFCVSDVSLESFAAFAVHVGDAMQTDWARNGRRTADALMS